MDIDNLKNVTAAKTQIASSHERREAKTAHASHRNEETAKKAETARQNAMSIKVVGMNYDPDIDRVIITVVDSRSQEVVLQIPESDSINFMKRFKLMIQESINKKV